MAAVLTELIALLGGAITEFASYIGTGVATLVKDFMLEGAGTQADPYKLSVFGGVIAIFGGVALAIGISTRIFNMIATLGGSR